MPITTKKVKILVRKTKRITPYPQRHAEALANARAFLGLEQIDRLTVNAPTLHLSREEKFRLTTQTC